MIAVIAGGSGMVGTALKVFLKKEGYEVRILSRKAKDPLCEWDPSKGYIHPETLDNADLIINLTGANVAGHRWSKAYKKEMYDSRLDSVKTLSAALKTAQPRQRHWMQASGVGYYAQGDEWMREDGPKGSDFLANLCADWEAAALANHSEGTTVAVLRFGLVLKKGEGLLGKMVPIARLGLSSAFGSGRQYMSWIHIDDLCGMMGFIIRHRLEGMFNAVSDEPVTNKEMTAAIARAVKSPFFLPPVPKWALRLLFGELGSELLSNHRVSNERIREAGFVFQYPVLEEALRAST